jgi:hypothetical protein
VRAKSDLVSMASTATLEGRTSCNLIYYIVFWRLFSFSSRTGTSSTLNSSIVFSRLLTEYGFSDSYLYIGNLSDSLNVGALSDGYFLEGSRCDGDF